MENLEFIIIGVVIAIVATSLFLNHQRQKAVNRYDQVYAFRIYVLATYGTELFDRLPPFRVMLKDGKPLTMEAYFSNLDTF